MKMVKSTLAVLTTAAVLGVSGFAQAGSTLDAVQKKGFVQCGISDGLPGFSYADAKGNYLGLDVDVCRAVAAAVLVDLDAARLQAAVAQIGSAAVSHQVADVSDEAQMRADGTWVDLDEDEDDGEPETKA